MRLSCLPVSFFAEILDGRMTLAEWARLGHSLGLEAIDLSILFLPQRSVEAAHGARRQIEDAGSRVAMITTYPDFTHPDAAQRRRELELAIESVGVAEALGADLIRVTAGQAHPSTGRAEGIAWAVDGLSRLVDAVRTSPVRPVYENHAKPGAWEYTDFSTPPGIFLEIARGTAPAGLGINFDTGNAAAFAADPLALLDQVIDRVVSVHIADTAAFGELKPVLIGTGIAPIAASFERLVAHGWDGWLCMEEASFQGSAGVEAAARFVRRAWEQACAVRAHG
ncbi:MAG: sugar phosphate isomerase/epimerase [Anaerolineales bacterium]|nr:sugar phosphate isomerase/epimerase [Anaerolineales bacterium]